MDYNLSYYHTKIPLIFLLIVCICERAFSQECKGLPTTRIDINITGRIPKITNVLSRLYRIPINVEEDFSYNPEAGSPQNLCDGVGYGTIKAKRITLCEALQILTRHVDTRYTWTWNGKVVNVFPWRLQFDPDYIMNQHIVGIRIQSKNIYEIVRVINDKLFEDNYYLHLYKPDVVIYIGSASLFSYCEDQEKKINLSMNKLLTLQLSGNLRNIMNEVTIALGRNFIWSLESRYTMGGKENDFGTSESYLLQSIKVLDYMADCSGSFDLPRPESIKNCSLQPLRHNFIATNLYYCDSDKIGWKRIEINDAPMESAVLILSSKFNIPVHFESVLWQKDFTNQYSNRRKINLKGVYTIAESLEAITTQDERYTWRWWECKAINVYPKYDWYDPYYLMNLTSQHLDLAGTTMIDGIIKISNIIRARNRVIKVDMSHVEKTKEKSFSMSFSGVALRDVLNALFNVFDDRISWHYRRWTVLSGMEDREKWWWGMEAHSELVPVLPEMERAE